MINLADIKARVEMARPIVFFNTQMSNGNAEFLSNAKADVTDLIAEVERLTAELADMKEQRDRALDGLGTLSEFRHDY